MLIDSPEIRGNPAFAARLSTDQTGIITVTHTLVEFNTEDFDITSDYDASSTYRFTPSVAGIYLIGAGIAIDDLSDGKLVIISMYKNNNPVVRSIQMSSLANTIVGATLNFPVQMNGSTDYLEIFGYHDEGSNQAFNGNGEDCYFHGHLIQRT